MTKTLINWINWYKSHLICLLAMYCSELFMSVWICTIMSANCSFFGYTKYLALESRSLHLKVLLTSKQVYFVIQQLLHMVFQYRYFEHGSFSEPQKALGFAHLKQSWYCRRGRGGNFPVEFAKQWVSESWYNLLQRICWLVWMFTREKIIFFHI